MRSWTASFTTLIVSSSRATVCAVTPATRTNSEPPRSRSSRARCTTPFVSALRCARDPLAAVVRTRPHCRKQQQPLDCQPSTSVAEYCRAASPINACLRPPPPAARGLDRACRPAVLRQDRRQDAAEQNTREASITPEQPATITRSLDQDNLPGHDKPSVAFATTPMLSNHR